MEKLKSLHGLRGCAAIAVVIFHQAHIARESFPGIWQTLTEPFYLSVQLFFVLSAFSLCFANAHKPVTLGDYALRRFLRLAPLFWLIACFQIWRSGEVDFLTLFLNVSLLFNLIPGYEASLVWAGWSVGVEVLFYILLPLLWLIGRRTALLLAATVAALLLSIWFWSHTANNANYPLYFAYFSIIGNLPQFMFGILAFKLFQTWRAKEVHRVWISTMLNGLSIGVVVFLLLDPMQLRGRVPGVYIAIWGLMFAAVTFAQAINPSKLLSSLSLGWLADRSYGIYLFHPMVIQFSKPIYDNISRDFSIGSAGVFAVSLIYTLMITFLLAHISFTLFERPIYRLADRRKIKPSAL
jgi:peptidoglycan/LPS O-acetylase OafA/YrhL